MEVQIKNPKTGEVITAGTKSFEYLRKKGWVLANGEPQAETPEGEKKPVEVAGKVELENDEPAAENKAPEVEEQAPEKRTRKTRVSVPNE